MKINIFHYHLDPGGVTRIIQSQVEGLSKSKPSPEIKIITGRCPDPSTYQGMGAEVVILEEMKYLENRKFSFEEVNRRASLLTQELLKEVSRDEILHFHNLNLGKNPVVTIAMHRLAATGYKLFNHVHDLAEDRPSNMEFIKAVIEDTYGLDMKEVLYPDMENVLFGALNSRDVKRIHEFGIPENRIFFLPNPVRMNEIHQVPRQEARARITSRLGLDPGKKIMTYPVRVIRRKNIGEYILLGALFHEEAEWLVTLPPQNPVEVTPYEEWKDFCRKEGIPVHFEVGTRVDFDELLSATDMCITTSAMEGFGMVFMEPWLMSTPVAGRNIGYVTVDLIRAGMEFPMLYDRLAIPEKDADFKDLDPKSQKEIIRDAWHDRNGMKSDILRLNAWMRSMLEIPGQEVVDNNIRCIREEFSLEKYTQRLYEAYRRFTHRT